MNINDCINQVVIFNEIAGNLYDVDYGKLVAQARVVKEEGDELLCATVTGDKNEILKEAVDVLVTIHGFVKMLEEQGYDVMAAWNEVNVNNLSKFPKNHEEDEKSLNYYSELGIDVTSEYNKEYGVTVLKDTNGKVRKPINYKKCSVASYTPKGILPKVKIDNTGDDQ